MSIKCSLLGHSFGETTVEREREEQGTEVVITITEMETCSRCGETRVVSENKEVTTLETPEGGADEFEATPGEGADDTADVVDAGESADAGESDASGDDGGAGDEGVGGSDATDAVILDDDSGAESSAQAEARGAETTIPDAEDGATAEAEVDSDEDDAVIIGDDEGDDRAPGEWPDEEAEPEGDHSPDDEGDTDDDDDATADERAPDAEGDDRDPGEWPDEPSDPAERAGETAEVEILGGGDQDGDAETGGDGSASEDGVGGPDLADAPAADSPDADAGGGDGANGDAASDDVAGAWPEEEDPSTGAESMGEWPEETKRDQPTDPGAAGPSLDGEETPSVTVPEGTFKCSECDFSTEADATSLRAGDFCPECRRGTLLEHADTVAEE
ncbi:hypothetical protein I7X12_13215 [Halosimplex litoreum]|uniref:Uncharacterized protein n=1 Tax=Halosimplex litoreum TaxID=1198301 RepID=A0A7T3KU90_9EURY|nr:hypothetical protein [Halosimplex litoreum]QPV61708.1 hypothetical protein I7X12_13215 [Halosimplex litoreum]